MQYVGECAQSYIIDIGSEINVQCEWHKPLGIPVCSGDWYDSGFILMLIILQMG